MKKQLKKTVLLAFCLSIITLPSLAGEETQAEKKPNTDYRLLFNEGTPNLVSPHVWKKDTLFTMVSHNWFVQSFPKGSNASGAISYTPFNNFQVDGLLTLRGGIEAELGLKYQLLNQEEGASVSFSPRAAYNTRGNIFGIDLCIDRIFFEDRLQLGLSYTFLSSGAPENVNHIVQAVGLNTTTRVWGHWYLFGDIVLPLDEKLITSKGFIWSAGIKDQMIGTPHNLTLYIGNTNLHTLTARTISVNNTYPDVLRAGFEFSIIFEELAKLPKLIFS
jgi:hypothetical protein